MLMRVAPSHLRFGHFEHFYYRRESEKVRQLADFAIRHYWSRQYFRAFSAKCANAQKNLKAEFLPRKIA